MKNDDNYKDYLWIDMREIVTYSTSQRRNYCDLELLSMKNGKFENFHPGYRCPCTHNSKNKKFHNETTKAPCKPSQSKDRYGEAWKEVRYGAGDAPLAVGLHEASAV